MIKKIQVFVVLSAIVCWASSAVADPDIQEGMWEIEIAAKMGGMQMPAQKHTQCFEGDDLVPMDPSAPQSCVVKEKRYVGNTLKWTMDCSVDGVKTVSKGSVAYAKDSFSGTMDLTISGSDMTVTNIMSGRRVGPCK